MLVAALILAQIAAPVGHDHDHTRTPAATATFDETLGFADENPLVKAARAATRVKRDWNARTSSLTHNPQISIQPGLRILPRDAREPEFIAEITQPWSVAGHGSARRDAIGLEAAALEAQERALRLDKRLGAARTWIDLWAAEQIIVELRAEEKIASQLETLVSRSADLGAATKADLADARTFAAEAHLAVLAAEGELFDRGVELAVALGRKRPGPVRTAGDAPKPPLPDSVLRGELPERLDELPDLRLRAVRTRAERARAIEEHAARGSVLALGISAQRDAPGGFVASLVGRLSFSVFDRGERERGRSAAVAEEHEGAAQNAQLEAGGVLVAAIHEVEHTAAIETELATHLMPAAREAADLRRRIHQQGDATLLEVLQSERAAVAAASRLARARGATVWARVKLWLLLTSLTTPTTTER